MKAMTYEQFMTNVYPEPNTGCWLWSGAQHPRYGHGSLNAKTHNGFSWAHRFMYFLSFGEFDRSLCVCHKCDIPWCVNPEHLFLGTANDNHKDKFNKRRHIHGESHPSAKLNNEIIRHIKSSKGITTNKDLHILYGVSDSLISLIRSGKRWGHIK